MELIFSINQEIRKDEVFLILYIAEKDSSKIVYGLDLLKWGEKDKELLKLLMQELRIEFPGKDIGNIPCDVIRVRASFAWEIVQKLLALKLLSWKGRSIFWNPFSKYAVRLEAEEEGESLMVTGSISIDGKWHSFSAVDFLFPGVFLKAPMWGFCKQVLFVLPSDIRFSYLERFYPGGAILEGKEKASFLDAYLEDQPRGFPEIVWQLSKESPPLIFPILILKDRHGAFASLQMDYQTHVIDFTDSAAFYKRDRPQEIAWEKDLLETGFTRKDLGVSTYYCPMDKVEKAISFLLDLGWKILDQSGRLLLKLSSSSLHMQESASGIAISGGFSYGEDHHVSLSQVTDTLRGQSKILDLGPGFCGWLGGQGYEGIEDLTPIERISDGHLLPKKHFGQLERLAKRADVAMDRQVESLLAKLTAVSEIEEEDEEDSLFQGTLLPYQKEGRKWLSFLYRNGFSGLLADEMGLGKTVQTLSFLSGLSSDKPILLVVPTSLVFNWKKEWEKFIPHKKLYVYEGKKRGGIEGQGAILTSYAYLRLDQALFSQTAFSWIVLDEAQMIKNPDSQLAKAACSLQAEGRIALTGTPIENKADDLWSLFHFLDKALLGEKKAFLASKVKASRILRPFILRRTKEEVALDLPEKFEQDVWVEMKEEQSALYREWLLKARKGLLHKVEMGSGSTRQMEILEAILRLRQICCDPRLIGSFVESAKVERVLLDLEEILAENRKVLIYSQFTQILKLLESEIQKKGWGSVYLDGQTKNREEVVDRFQNDPEVSIFLISLKAGGVGLNLTAADYVFIFDPWWNDAAERQALARTHRIGRKQVVIARRYLTAGTLEEKIMQLKAHKSALAKGLLDFEDSSLSLSDMEDLLTPLDLDDPAQEDLQPPL